MLRDLPRGATLRAAVALAVPALIGILTGHIALGVVASVGVLWGVGQDGCDPYRSRIVRLAWTGSAAAGGLLAGEVVLRSGDPLAVLLTLVVAGLIAGAVSSQGRVPSVAGLHLLLGVVVGSGMPIPGPLWSGPLALISGVFLILGLTVAPWLWARQSIEIEAVQAVYRAASRALSAAGTPAAPDTRRQLADALDNAHQVLRPNSSPRLRRSFILAIHLAEAVTTLLWEGRPLPGTVTSVPLQLERRAGTSEIRALPTRFATTTPGLRALAAVCETAGRPEIEEIPLEPALRHRPGRAETLRYALLLATAVLVTQLIADELPGPRNYWLPMTVAFVYKPDLGPVFARALNRCLGTVAGVAVTAVIAFWVSNPYVWLLMLAVFGAVMAVGVRHHYAVATAGLTVAVLALLDLLGDERPLAGPRILDTTLAAGVVLVLHFALWPRSAAVSADEQVHTAIAAVQRYRHLAPGAGPLRRHVLRRSAYQGLGAARRAVAQARREPSLRGFPDWEPVISRAERLCDVVTARVVASAVPDTAVGALAVRS
jgi:uncharacterized membrane protein YccC